MGILFGLSKKKFFGQPLTVITLPKAEKKLHYAVFCPLAGKKLHKTKIYGAFGRVMQFEVVQKANLFGQPLLA
jgi:hypothetical protein